MKDLGITAREEIAAGRAKDVGAVFIGTSPEPFAVWGGYGPLDLYGQTFTGIGDTGLVSATGGAVGTGDQAVTLSLSGVQPEVLELLDPRAAQGAEVVVYRLVFDGTGHNLLAAPIFKRGKLDQINSRDTVGGTATVSAMVEGAVRGSGRSGGRIRSDADQRLCDPDDAGMAGVAHAGETTIYWGGKPGQNSQVAFEAQPAGFWQVISTAFRNRS